MCQFGYFPHLYISSNQRKCNWETKVFYCRFLLRVFLECQYMMPVGQTRNPFTTRVTNIDSGQVWIFTALLLLIRTQGTVQMFEIVGYLKSQEQRGYCEVGKLLSLSDFLVCPGFKADYRTSASLPVYFCRFSHRASDTGIFLSDTLCRTADRGLRMARNDRLDLKLHTQDWATLTGAIYRFTFTASLRYLGDNVRSIVRQNAVE